MLAVKLLLLMAFFGLAHVDSVQQANSNISPLRSVCILIYGETVKRKKFFLEL